MFLDRLHSLSCSKHKVLNKEPNKKIVIQSDYFKFNAKFTDKSRKIKVQANKPSLFDFMQIL